MADGLADPGAGRDAKVLALYAAAGIPVIAADGRSLTTSGDTVGVPWPVVWATASAPDVARRLPLRSLTKGLAATLGEGMDANIVAEDFVSGLRSALHEDADRPGPAFVARLVREEGLRYTGADLADTSTTAADLFVSVPTAGALLSIGVLASVAGPSAHSSGLIAPGPGAGPVELPSPLRKCNPQMTLDWVVWLLAKVAGGVEVPGFKAWEGLFRKLIEHLTSGHKGEAAPSSSGEVTAPELATKVAGIVATYLTFVELLVAVMAVGSPGTELEFAL